MFGLREVKILNMDKERDISSMERFNARNRGFDARSSE
jgi:hypothetical protein